MGGPTGKTANPLMVPDIENKAGSAVRVPVAYMVCNQASPRAPLRCAP